MLKALAATAQLADSKPLSTRGPGPVVFVKGGAIKHVLPQWPPDAKRPKQQPAQVSGRLLKPNSQEKNPIGPPEHCETVGGAEVPEQEPLKWGKGRTHILQARAPARGPLDDHGRERTRMNKGACAQG